MWLLLPSYKVGGVLGYPCRVLCVQTQPLKVPQIEKIAHKKRKEGARFNNTLPPTKKLPSCLRACAKTLSNSFYYSFLSIGKPTTTKAKRVVIVSYNCSAVCISIESPTLSFCLFRAPCSLYLRSTCSSTSQRRKRLYGLNFAVIRDCPHCQPFTFTYETSVA